MPIPEFTSAEAFERFVGGNCLRSCRGKAWRDIQAYLIAPPRVVEAIQLPAVSEPFLAWSVSGEAEFQEREGNQPWITHHLKKGSLFLTSGGAPYECRWRAISAEPFHSLAVFIGLPLLQRAMAEVFGTVAPPARLRDLSAFSDGVLNAYLAQVHAELLRKEASPLFLQGIAQAIAIHLARNYAETSPVALPSSAALPGHKLRRITDWMADHLAEDFNLDRLAAQAGLSKFYFNRLFKNALGVAPSRYQINLRMEAARRRLRETKQSVVDIALEVGYANPSHFAQLFRRETGLSPSNYRRQR